MSLFPALSSVAAQQALALIYVRGRRIANFIPNIIIEENHVDTLSVTRHPVDRQAEITDHAYNEPPEVTIRVGYSNSPVLSFTGLASLVSDFLNPFALLGNPDYVSSVYAQFLALKQGAVPFTIVTGKRTYDNMLIVRMTTTTDERTEDALILTLECRNVILVDTQVVTMPPASQQKSPAITNPITMNGVKSTLNSNTQVTLPQ